MALHHHHQKYTLESKGTQESFGTSSVLGTGAPQFKLFGLGADVGCADAGGIESIVTSNATVADGSASVLVDSTASFHRFAAGSRVKISGSLDSQKVYFVERIHDEGFQLSEPYLGSSQLNTARVTVVSGAIPRVETEIIRGGSDEYAYDIYFTGAYWSQVPQMTINRFGDGTCL